MKQLFFILISFSLTLNSFAQTASEDCMTKVEEFILDKKLDSALIAIEDCSFEPKIYKDIVKNICQGKPVSPTEYLKFFSRLASNQSFNSFKVLEAYREFVPKPDHKELDYDHSRTLYAILNRLANDSDLESADELHKELEDYANSFESGSRDVRRTRVLLDAHTIMLKVIEMDMEGLAMNEKSEKEAIALQDTNLIALTLYNRCDFLIMQGKLDEFIAASQRIYDLDKMREKHGDLYHGNLMHLIDALIYKGGQDSLVQELLNELYESRFGSASYSLYAKYLTYSPPNSEQAQKVFNKFNVENIVECCDTLSQLSKIYNPADHSHTLIECSNVLSNYGEYQLAMQYMRELNQLTKTTYSQELSKSLADHKSRLIEKEKELAIENEKTLTKTYAVAAIITVILFILLLVIFLRQRKQGKLLQKKNKQIEEQRKVLEKSDGEKAVLLKEIHHRVKNNFQIVSSLLELHAKNIEDEKALELTLEGQNRIKSMAIIHQRLYQNDDLLIYINEYTEKLLSEVENIFGNKNVKTEIDIDKNVALDIDTAIPFGLILNELITNSFKYGISGDNQKISIRLTEQLNNYELTVADNGNGIPESIDIMKTKSIGLRLVRRLTKQIKGSFNYKNENGAVFQIQFAKPN